VREAQAAASQAALDALLASKRVVVTCGAGGVGKTTTAAALALRAALAGRKVLVLTIDPARRLAQAMGLEAGGSAPTPVPPERLAAEGLGPARLEAWMLSPGAVLERMVRSGSASKEAAEGALQNRLTQALGELVAGMQEYAAAEALYGFVSEGRYDLVVLDTPPSRNALDFLEAPGRLTRFVDDRILSVFLPSGGGGRLWRAGQTLVGKVLDSLFGAAFAQEMREFLGGFAPLLGLLRRRTEELRALLASPSSAFLLVTSPEPLALEEARFFASALRERGMPLAGVVLNRSWARAEGLVRPATLPLAPDAPGARHAALAHLEQLAVDERALSAEHAAILERLARELPQGAFALATPELGASLDSLAGLSRLVAPPES
jgi:anion-transporting  ArsA/GET3 family ATPase